jgi:hypothetical protein
MDLWVQLYPDPTVAAQTALTSLDLASSDALWAQAGQNVADGKEAPHKQQEAAEHAVEAQD